MLRFLKSRHRPGLMVNPTGMRCSTRFQSTMPNKKGVRQPPPVPDRLKDAMHYFGNTSNVVMEDSPFVPQEKRQNLLKEVMGMQQNMRTGSKLDKLRQALDRCYHKDEHQEDWNEIYLFMRTTEMCTEVHRLPTDVFPRGNTLWLELEHVEEKRQPYFFLMPNGMIVLPIFSFEEYMNTWFGRVGVFESCWFPVPRMGTRYEEFCKLPFPVAALGPLANHAALATMSVPEGQFGILLNPGERASKFVTYPEMVYLAKHKKHTSINESELGFDLSLRKTFNTSKMPMTRLSVEEVREHLKSRPSIPQIAQLELQLLVFPFADVAEVYVRTVPRPKWKQLLGGGSHFMTQIDIVVFDSDKSRPWRVELVEKIRRWSFMAEFKSDVHIEYTSTKPEAVPGQRAPMKLYGAEDGAMYRQLVTFKGVTLKESLNFDEPIVDAQGRRMEVAERKNF